jgi:hypothetical protein
MPGIRASRVIHLSIAGALVLASLVTYPLLVSTWAELQDRSAQERDYAAASDPNQRSIVKAILSLETAELDACDHSRPCPEERVYFDHEFATLLSADDPRPWKRHEQRMARPYDSLVDRGDHSTPIRLQELLDRLVQESGSNADPELPDVTFISDPGDMPKLGEPENCNTPEIPRLVRISRAAVQESKGQAIALVSRIFCDGSGSYKIVALRLKGSAWVVGRYRDDDP